MIESRKYLRKGNFQLGIVNKILIQLPPLLKISEATCPTILFSYSRKCRITLLWNPVSCLNRLETQHPKQTLQSPLLSQTKPLHQKYWKIIVVSTSSPKSHATQYNMVKTTKSRETYLRWRKTKREQEPSMENNRAQRITFDGEQQSWLGCRDKHFKI